MSEQNEALSGWAIVEQLGHKRLASYVSERTIAGHGFLQIDVPGGEHVPPVTQFIEPSTVYAITPTTEEIARAVAAVNRPEPVHRWELPALKQEPARPSIPDYYEPEEYTGDDDDDDAPRRNPEVPAL